MIPKIINHIWLQGKENIPEKYFKNQEFWKLYNFKYEFGIWDEIGTIEKVKNELPDFIKYIDESNTLINKINVIKYLNLYFYGGIYTDLDTFPLKSIDELLDEDDLGNIDIDSKISFRYPFSIERDNKKIGDYDIVIPCRNSLVFYPDGRKILLFDNPFLISTPRNEFWLKLIEYCSKRTELKHDTEGILKHEPYGPFGLTDFVFNEYYKINEHNICILPHYFIFSHDEEKYDKKFVIHSANSEWK